MNQELKDAIKILRSWHQIEFFQPYTTPDHDDKFWGSMIREEELLRMLDDALPWVNSAWLVIG